MNSTMKTYVLIVSLVFPKTHARAGEPTYFREKLITGEKLHTIRANYHLWKKRIDEVNAGEAILSVRYWSGKPYNSKQLRIVEFDKDSGVGVQQLDLTVYGRNGLAFVNYKNDSGFGAKLVSTGDLSKNDGLSLEYFREWFRKYDLSKPMAVIHFTKFRY